MQEIIANTKVEGEAEEISVNVFVPKGLWLRARAMAALSDQHLKYFVAEAIEEHIQRQQGVKQA